jgi:TRAP-type C4-dicarboxylate transport system permease small subunit
MSSNKIEGVIITLETWLLYLTMAIIFGLALLTGVQVIGRYFFSYSIKGYVELGEITMLLIAFLASAYTMRVKGHVATDMVTAYLPHHVKSLTGGIMNLLCAIFLGSLVYQLTVDAFWQWHVKTVLMNVDIPIFPFYFLAAFGALFFAVEVLVQSLKCFADAVKQQTQPQSRR